MKEILLVVVKQVSSRHHLPTTTSVVLKDPPGLCCNKPCYFGRADSMVTLGNFLGRSEGCKYQ